MLSPKNLDMQMNRVLEPRSSERWSVCEMMLLTPRCVSCIDKDLKTALMAIWPDVVKGDLEAIKVMLKILERDAKLYGIDAPVKTEMEVTTYDGNLLRQRTREIVEAIREIRESPDSVGERFGEAGAVTE